MYFTFAPYEKLSSICPASMLVKFGLVILRLSVAQCVFAAQPFASKMVITEQFNFRHLWSTISIAIIGTFILAVACGCNATMM
jgi:hypothetical protein